MAQAVADGELMTSVDVPKAMTLKPIDEEAEVRSDGALLKAFSRGDTLAFDELYGRYRQPLYNFLRRNCNDEATANELFQDLWLSVVSSAGRYQDQGRFRSWLFSMAHNRLVDLYRQSSRRRHDEYIDSPGGGCVEDQVANLERREVLQQVLASLPLDQRSAFVLREDAGLALKDIAQIQGISLEAAKSRLRYAYRKLRDAMKGLDL
jgi:RNA polymerase sigma-70 factor (ECF subfamily)